MREQIVRQPGPVGRHTVSALNRPDRDRVLVSSLVPHHPNALHGQQHGEALPQFRVPAVAPHLRDDDRVGAPQQSEPLGRHLTKNPDGEARPLWSKAAAG